MMKEDRALKDTIRQVVLFKSPLCTYYKIQCLDVSLCVYSFNISQSKFSLFVEFSKKDCVIICIVIVFSEYVIFLLKHDDK
jgi:hypothetical protein